jgi:hypothetical protein
MCTVLACSTLVAGGCFSFSGRTVIEEKPETIGRISALEARVSALEQLVSPRLIPEQVGPPTLDEPR